MKNNTLQLHLIDTLDNIVARIEEMVTEPSTLTQISIDIIKTDIRSLYKDICEIERTELDSPATNVHRMKDSVNELKKKLELFNREDFSESDPIDAAHPHPMFEPMAEESVTFRPVIEAQPITVADTPEIEIPDSENNSESLTETSAAEEDEEEFLPRRNESYTDPENHEEPNGFSRIASESSESPETVHPTDESDTDLGTCRESVPEFNEFFEPSRMEPETASPAGFASESEPDTVEPNRPENMTPGDESSQETDCQENPYTETDEYQASETSEAETSETEMPDLSDFISRADDEPTSYVTRLTAMAQAQAGEQDMSKVAVSSTAMPDENVVRQVENRSGIFSKLKETEALHASNPQNALQSLVDRLKTAKTVNDVRHTQNADFRSSIGINEKFLFINELFKGNIKEYGEMLQKLDTAQNQAQMTEIIQPLHDKYGWNQKSLAYITLAELLKKKFGGVPDIGSDR